METTTTRYEHRTIETVNLGKFYGEDFILPAGIVLKKTKNGGKYTRYTYEHTYHETFNVDGAKVGVFKITRTVTETEEML
jgi:hypothetical protein